MKVSVLSRQFNKIVYRDVFIGFSASYTATLKGFKVKSGEGVERLPVLKSFKVKQETLRPSGWVSKSENSEYCGA